MTSWEEIGRQLQGYYAPQWHRQNENSQCWCQTLSNSCRLKSPLWPKGEHRDGIFCGIRSSSCQRYPLGPPPLQTNWSGLCRVQLRAKNKKKRPLQCLGLCMWVANLRPPYANLRFKCYTAENTSLLRGATSQVPITSGISAPFWSSPHFNTSHY